MTVKDGNADFIQDHGERTTVMEFFSGEERLDSTPNIASGTL